MLLHSSSSKKARCRYSFKPVRQGLDPTIYNRETQAPVAVDMKPHYLLLFILGS